MKSSIINELPASSTFVQDDKLDRISLADRLNNIIINLNPPYTINIDAKYGSGKSSFLKMFKNMLIDQGYKVVFYNAYETDYFENPLIAVTGELYSIIKIIKSEDDENVKTIVEEAGKIGKCLLQNSIPILTGILSKALLPVETADEITKMIQGTLSDYASEQIKDHEKTKESMITLSRALTSITETLDKPMVFIIDELDRCKPTFAVEVLEIIKHIFTIPNLVFIIATDTEELKHIIEHYYGIKSSDDYLKKYFTFTYSLPHTQLSDLLTSYQNKLASLFGPGNIPYIDSAVENINNIPSIELLPIRNLDRIVNSYICFFSQYPKLIILGRFIIPLIFLKELHPIEFHALTISMDHGQFHSLLGLAFKHNPHSEYDAVYHHLYGGIQKINMSEQATYENVNRILNTALDNPDDLNSTFSSIIANSI